MAETKGLLDRLTRQLASKGESNARGMATALLKKQGSLDSKGKLTSHGKARQALGAAGRAKSRQAEYSGRKPSEFTYNAKTNRATVRKGAK